MKKALLFLSLMTVLSQACSVTIDITPNAEVPTADSTPVLFEPATTTPEVFIARTQAIPAQVQLNGTMLAVREARLGRCDLPDCPPAPAGTRYLRVPLQAINLPAGDSLDYKNLPQGIAVYDETGTRTPFDRILAYKPDTQELILYFTVPETATVFELQWPDVAPVPLTVTVDDPVVAGTAVSYDRLSLLLPLDIASGISGVQVQPANGQDLPYWELTPGHMVITLEGYALQDKFHQPRIYVYPATAYGELLPGAFESIRRLDNILYAPGGPALTDELPSIPFFNAAQVFAADIQLLSFQNGGGVRFVTEYAQYATSANNTDLFYHFQGVTRDGAYYIVAILPITAPKLAETSDGGAPLPEGGIPYPYFAEGANADMQTYYASVTDLLNGTPPDAFSPSLTHLDALIQSIQVNP